jgi:hypothetical protein
LCTPHAYRPDKYLSTHCDALVTTCNLATGSEPSGKDARSQLAQVGAINSQEPGAYEFALALQQDPHYRLISGGPVNSGYGSFGSEPSTFFIWPRIKAPAAPSLAHRPAASARPSARSHQGH